MTTNNDNKHLNRETFFSMSSSSRFAGAVASPRLTPVIVHELRINIIKAAFPISEMPSRKRKLPDPPTITELPEWDMDCFWYGDFGDLIEDELKIPRSTNDDIPKTV